MTRPIAIVLLLFAAHAAGAAAGIEAVQTYGQLRGQRPIALEGNATVHIGIETGEAKRSGGLLVYCLTEKYQPARRFSGDVDRRLGPLEVIARRTDDPVREVRALAEVMMPDRVKGVPDPLLFATAVTFPEEGEYQVDLRLPRGNGEAPGPVLASTRLKVSGRAHPWVRLAPMHGERRAEDAATPIMAVPDGPPVLPRWVGLDPLPAPEKPLPDNAPLPRLVPDDAKPAMKLAIDGRILTIASAEPFLTSHAHGHFIARWWINDKPVRPRPEGQLFADQNGKLEMGDRLRLELHFDREALGAQAGDRIGLQLLYCPDGWTMVEEMAQLMAALTNSADRMPRVTNRVEFVAK